jgi:biotin synthetase
MEEILQKILNENSVSKEEALKLYDLELEDLLFAASKVRKKHKGGKVKVCSIINAKSGQCGENCKFCAQSSFSNTNAEVYPLKAPEIIVDCAKNAFDKKAGCFGIVSSGNYLNDEEIDLLCNAFKENPNVNKISVSIGSLSDSALVKLRRAGISKIHHNLETSEKYFPNVCTTHTFSERMETVKKAKSFGFKICSGGLFGIGESREDRIALAFALKELEVESVPMNFFIPIKGTPLENAERLTPNEILKTISIFRLILPEQDIMICGGREVNLRDLQSLIFQAGANGMMSGGYLTTGGRDRDTDLEMIKDLGLEIE